MLSLILKQLDLVIIIRWYLLRKYAIKGLSGLTIDVV